MVGWRRPMQWPTILVAVCALALGTGCATKPIARVDHAEIRGASTYGLGVQVFLRVKNENSFDIQIRRVRGRAVFGRGFAMPVDVSPNQWLASDSTTVVAVPLWIPWNIVPGLVAESVGSPIIPYRLTGKADITAIRLLGVDRDDFPVDEYGVVPRDVVIGAARSVIPL